MIPRGTTTTLTADAADPDGDPVRFRWATMPGPCPADDNMPVLSSDYGPSYTLMPSPTAIDMGQICVGVAAIDRYGATSTRWFTLAIGNTIPRASITVQGLIPNPDKTYDLYSTFRLSGAGSFDPDGQPLTYTWTLMPGPNDSNVALVDCDPTASIHKLVQCLGPITKPGLYDVLLTVNDGIADSTPFDLPLHIADDRDPWLTQFSPADSTAHVIWDPTLDKTFEVDGVSDDGSPYPSANPPNGSPLFSWSLRRVGDTVWETIAGYRLLPSVVIPGGRFTIGDSVQVRVEVRDHATHPVDTLGTLCGDQPICPSTHPERVTWTIDYR